MDEFIVQELLKTSNASLESSSDESETSRVTSTRIANYMEVVEAYSDQEFKEHFRLNRITIASVIEDYEQKLPAVKSGWPSINGKKAVYMTLWYLANTESFRQISDRFNVTISSAHRVIKLVLQHLVSISETYIKWPNKQEAEHEERNFYLKKGLRHIIGAIDGSHLKILRPMQSEEDYLNRKGYHSVLLQGVVNSKKMFINIKAGEPGSMHDARMLRRSFIYQLAEEDYETLFYGKYCLLGDSAYPTLRWLITPHKDNGHLTEEQREYNYRHSATRMVVEHTFGLLKGRFRRIRQFENIDQTIIINSIIAACVLHNMCILYNDNFDEIIEENLDSDN